jgi:hypothetical protein
MRKNYGGSILRFSSSLWLETQLGELSQGKTITHPKKVTVSLRFLLSGNLSSIHE